MGNRSDLNNVVATLRTMLVSNKDLLKILHYDGKDIDIYDSKYDLSPTIAKSVVKDKILPYEKEFTDNEKCCYMFMLYGDKAYHQRNNHYFNGNTLVFYILCDRDIVYNNYIGNRTYEIEGIIKEVFDGATVDEVVGVCHVVSSEPVSAKGTNYSGRKVTIAFSDFNSKNGEVR